MLKRARSSIIVIAALSILTFVVVSGTLVSAQRQTSVVVASDSLEVGTRIAEQDIELRSIHTTDVLPGAYTKIEDVIGQNLTVQRMAGDQITGDMVGTSAMNALASSLPGDERAIAVHVNRAQGMAGLLRPGDHVSVVAVADSQALGNNFGGGLESSNSSDQNSVQPLQGPMAKLTLTGLRVLFVPWEFRYQEITPSKKDNNDLMSPVVTSRQGQDKGVVILSAPITPVTITWEITATETTATKPAGSTFRNKTVVTGTSSYNNNPKIEPQPQMVISPVELLALLDNTDAKIHLALEPTEQQGTVHTVGVTLENLIGRQEEADSGQRPQQP